ncbi:MAG TPA: GNAT family N-acetyltransferase [Methanocella sp.]
MTVRLIENGVLWDRFLDETPYGSIFHRWKMLKIVEKYCPFRFLPYGMYRSAELIGVFPLYFRSYRGMKLVFSPPPKSLLPYLGPVMGPTYRGLKQKRKETYLREAIDEIDAEIRKLAPNYVTLQTEPCFDDIRPFRSQKYHTDVSYDYIIDLTKPLEDVWAGFDSQCKKKIRHCEGRGLVMKPSDDVRAFYRIMNDSFESRGIRTIYNTGDPACLREFLEAFPENLKMYFLYEGDQIVGVNAITRYRNRTTGWQGCATGHYNEFMLWELMKLEKSLGMQVFEITGADDDRLNPFKSKFNPGLGLRFYANKKDTLGTIAEWTFTNLIKTWV